MKKILLLLLLTAIYTLGFSQSVGIGTDTPDTNAILEIRSDTKGLLIPRMDSTARKALPDTKGMMVYDTTTNSFWFNTGESWLKPVSSDGTQQLPPNGNDNGEMLYWQDGKWVLVPKGNEGEVLTFCNGKPTWGGCSKTLVLQPSNNTYEAELSDYYPNIWIPTQSQLVLSGWTSSGDPFDTRDLFQFDYSTIGNNAIVDSARLFLYADHTPLNGDQINAHSGSSNAFYVQRITSNWVFPNPFTWNNPPTTTATNQVTVPQSTSAFQDAVINVTGIVQDQITNGNHGFFMRLINETPYNVRQYCSSKHTDVSKHPKIIVYYHY